MAGDTVAQVASARRSLSRYLHSAPGTTIYLSVLIVTSLVVWTADPRLANRLLHAQSTNLHNMLHHPVSVLVLSAFWIEGGRLLPWVVPFALVMAPVERWIGTTRWLAVFAAGHIGATLVTVLGIWLVTRGGVTDSALVDTVDVGVSYGFYAVAAVLTPLLPGWWRWIVPTVVVGGLAVLAAEQHTFTDFGHLAAVAIGFGCRPIVLRRRASGDVRALLTGASA